MGLVELKKKLHAICKSMQSYNEWLDQKNKEFGKKIFYADFLKLPTIDLVTVDLSSWCRTKWICLMRMGMLRDSASVCLLCFAFF